MTDINELTTGEKIANAAVKWLGTPYVNNSLRQLLIAE